MDCKERAFRARAMYRAGAMTREEAVRETEGFAREFDAKARELARKYGVSAQRFSFSAFCR